MRRPKSLVGAVVTIGFIASLLPVLALFAVALLLVFIGVAKRERRQPIYYDAAAMRAAFDQHEVLTGAEVVHDAAA